MPALYAPYLLRPSFLGLLPHARRPLPSYLSWRVEDDDELPTLQAVFEALPDSVGFDIEVKMAVPSSVERTPDEEVERMLNSILPVVEQCAASSSRTILFSSFDPEVCTALSERLLAQPRPYPVMFLSECGSSPHCDPRRMSTGAAVEFAGAHGLAGVVVPAAVLKAQPELMQLAAGRGLKVLTYGGENSSAEVVQWQCSVGVHAAIVDDIAAVLR